MAKMNEVKPISLGPESKEETIESCPKGRERARICLVCRFDILLSKHYF